MPNPGTASCVLRVNVAEGGVFKAGGVPPTTEGDVITQLDDLSPLGNTLTIDPGTLTYTFDNNGGQPGLRAASGDTSVHIGSVAAIALNKRAVAVAVAYQTKNTDWDINAKILHDGQIPAAVTVFSVFEKWQPYGAIPAADNQKWGNPEPNVGIWWKRQHTDPADGIEGLCELFEASNTATPKHYYKRDFGGAPGSPNYYFNPTYRTTHGITFLATDTVADLTKDDICAEGNWLSTSNGGTSINFTAPIVNDQIRVFMVGDSRTDGTGGSPLMVDYVNEAVKTGILTGYRLYNLGFYGLSAGSIRTAEVPQITGNGTSIPSQFASGSGAVNVVFIWCGVNGSISGAAATVATIFAMCDDLRTAAAAQGVPLKIVLATETMDIDSYAPITYMQDVTTGIRAGWAAHADYLADLAADPILGDPATYNPPNTTYTDDGLHYKPAANSLLSAIISPKIIEAINDTLASIPLTTAPTGRRAYLDGGVVTITWDGLVGASTYDIKRIKADGTTDIIIGVTAPWQETGDYDPMPRGYQVRGVNDAGPGPWSGTVSLGGGGGGFNSIGTPLIGSNN